MKAERLRVAMFSTMLTGGAGYAALRVHESLRLGGADSTLYVGQGERSKHPGVKRLRGAEEGVQPARVPGLTIFSVDPPGISDADLDRIIATADVFNLHWYARFLSLRNIERLSRSGKPVVLTIRDMNPLAGGCHFFHGCEYWQHDCAPCPQFIPADIPLPNATLEAKRVLWDLANIAVVVLSDHTRDLVKKSPMFGRCRVEKIPNPMDVSVFKPQDRNRARAELGVSPNKKVVAYLPSFSSSVKGFAQAVEAFRLLAGRIPPRDCVVMCAGELDAPLNVPFETINIGFIADKRHLARFYAAADATLIPSTEETFSNTAAESVACGTPIVGFQVGAIPEIGQGPRGRAVPVNNIEMLAAALAELLAEEKPPSAQLHRFIEQSFSPTKIGPHYLRLFEDLCRNKRTKAHIHVGAADGAGPREAMDRFEQLLCRHQESRTIQIRVELEATMKKTRSLRGRLTLLARVARLFFSDNQAFRRQVWEILSER